MSWHGEELSDTHGFYRRSVDDDRGIQFERTGAYGKGAVTTFLLVWERQEYQVSADGPHEGPKGSPMAWMNFQVYLPDAARTFPPPTHEPAVDTAIEALLVHGRVGEGLLQPDRTFWVLRDKRIYSLGEDRALRSRDATDDEQREFTRTRKDLFDII